MRVFITGATGFVGREILRQLSGRGHAIRFLARHPDCPKVRHLAQRFHAEVVPGDVQKPETLEQALPGCDAVIHLVGIITEMGASTYEHVHRRGTHNVLRATRHAGVKRYVHMSALGTRPGAVSRYHQTKWEAEELVRASGLDYTIFRPSIIYGPDDMFVNLFARLSRFSPVIPIMGTGQGTLQPVSVESVGRCFVGALEQPQSIGQTYEVAGPEVYTLETVIDLILEVTGRRRLKVHLPFPLALGLAAVVEKVFPTVLRRQPPFNRDALRMGEEKTVGNPEPACQLFQLPREDFRQGIATYLK